jgi:hypothetical protein
LNIFWSTLCVSWEIEPKLMNEIVLTDINFHGHRIFRRWKHPMICI